MTWTMIVLTNEMDSSHERQETEKVDGDQASADDWCHWSCAHSLSCLSGPKLCHRTAVQRLQHSQQSFNVSFHKEASCLHSLQSNPNNYITHQNTFLSQLKIVMSSVDISLAPT